MPIAARDAYRLDREFDPRGFALRKGGRVVGQLPWHNQELVAALNHLDPVERSPRALRPTGTSTRRSRAADRARAEDLRRARRRVARTPRRALTAIGSASVAGETAGRRR